MNSGIARRPLIAALATAAPAWAREVAPAPPFRLPPLPYPPDANEPYIDSQTMIEHHDRVHGAYVARLNEALADYPRLAEPGLARMLALLPFIPMPEADRAAISENGGGHANHTMFWSVMGGKGSMPDGRVARAIDRDFGSFAALKQAFDSAGAAHVGDGWVFVTVNPSGALRLVTAPSEHTPWADGTAVLFGNDLWPHAYEAKYRNRRADYLIGWWNVLNWPAIEGRYVQATTGTLAI